MNASPRSNVEETMRIITFFITLLLCLGTGKSSAQEVPQQVRVSVKIIEFQTGKDRETGLSAYFQRRNKERAFGRVTSGNGAISTADFTFPTDTASGISVFLDALRMSEGDVEVVLQALVAENRASILSRPQTLVMVGAATDNIVKTTQKIPYENTKVVGVTAVQITDFRETGVTLSARCPEVIDDDGNTNTQGDTYIKLDLTATVNEEGQRITVALDDRAAGGIFAQADNAIDVPEFVSRSVKTSVWVRHGQVLLLGGLHRSSVTKSLATMPWLMDGEDAVMGVVNEVLPASVPAHPLSSALGNRTNSESQRELVFMIKAELWGASQTVADIFDFDFEDDGEEFPPPEGVPSDEEDTSAPPEEPSSPVEAPQEVDAAAAKGAE